MTDLRRQLPIIISTLLLMLPLTVTAQRSRDIVIDPAVNRDRKPGIVIMTELTGAAGLNERESPLSGHYLGVTGTVAYQFSPNIRVGAGTGVHRHNDATMVPLFMDARYSPAGRRVIPFIAAIGGVALSTTNLDSWSGLYINPAVGVRYLTSNSTGIVLAAGVMAMSGGGTGRLLFLNGRVGFDFKVK